MLTPDRVYYVPANGHTFRIAAADTPGVWVVEAPGGEVCFVIENPDEPGGYAGAGWAVDALLTAFVTADLEAAA